MRFAYDRFGIPPYGYKEQDFINPRFGYNSPSTRGAVGLEAAMTQMPEPNGSMGAYNKPPAKEEVYKARSGAIGQYRAI